MSLLRSFLVSLFRSRCSWLFLGSVSSRSTSFSSRSCRSSSCSSRFRVSLRSSISSKSINGNSEETSNKSSNNLVHFITFHKVTFKGSANQFAAYRVRHITLRTFPEAYAILLKWNEIPLDRADTIGLNLRAFTYFFFW